MDLKSKLGIYKKKEASPKVQTGPNSDDFFTDHGGRKIETSHGPVWRFESRYSFYKRRYVDIDSDRMDLAPFLRINGFEETISVNDLLFLDLETTSLSIAAGNYPFVCGIGYVDDEDFIVEQLFMESYADEPAMLHYLLDFFKKAKALVTYNGKTFDVPLVKNRYMINRIYGYPVDLPVIDLIIPSRRLFKSLFENCQLQTLEKEVLGFVREDDVPGWMVPEIFFTYQKDGNPERIPGVIEHNMYDIFSMHVLIVILAEVFQSIDRSDFERFEESSLYSLGRYLYKVNISTFLDLAEFLGDRIINDEGVFEKFSIILKRKQEWKEVITFWERSGSVFSLVELAKFYEHKEKDFEKAYGYTERAIAEEEKESGSSDLAENKTMNRLIYRKERLERKIKALKDRTDPSL